MRWPRRRRTRLPRTSALPIAVVTYSSRLNSDDSYHLGQLKAKLAKLRRELIEPRSGSGGGASLPAFEVAKTGMASVGFVGFPSVVSTLETLCLRNRRSRQYPLFRANQP